MLKKMGTSLTRWMILVGFGITSLLLIQFTSSVIVIGERLGRINGYFETCFYVLVLILGYVLLARPLTTILFASSIPLAKLSSEGGNVGHKQRFRIARLLLRDGELSDESKGLLSAALAENENLYPTLAKIIIEKKEAADKVIIQHAGRAFVGVAASQSGRLDALWIVGTNLLLIKDLVRTFCYRPSFPNLAKLYAVVAYAALFTEQLEDNMSETTEAISSLGVKTGFTFAGAEFLPLLFYRAQLRRC